MGRNLLTRLHTIQGPGRMSASTHGLSHHSCLHLRSHWDALRRSLQLDRCKVCRCYPIKIVHILKREGWMRQINVSSRLLASMKHRTFGQLQRDLRLIVGRPCNRGFSVSPSIPRLDSDVLRMWLRFRPTGGMTADCHLIGYRVRRVNARVGSMHAITKIS